MTIIEPGSYVSISRGLGAIRATVIAVNIEAGGSVTYRVAWWDDDVRYDAWVNAVEIDLTARDYLTPIEWETPKRPHPISRRLPTRHRTGLRPRKDPA
jgi:hypothetical protein